MHTVIVQPHKDSVLGTLETRWTGLPRYDVICSDCKAVLVEKLPSVQAAYCQAGAISELMSKHRCEGKVLVA